MALRIPAHNQQRSTGQRQAHGLQFAAPAVAQSEDPRVSETERCDHRARSEFRLVIGVQSHAVALVSIQIGQHAVEAGAGKILDATAQTLKLGEPGQGLVNNARVAVAGARIAIPRQQARLPIAFAEQLNALFTPGQRAFQQAEPLLGAPVQAGMGVPDKLRIRQVQTLGLRTAKDKIRRHL